MDGDIINDGPARVLQTKWNFGAKMGKASRFTRRGQLALDDS